MSAFDIDKIFSFVFPTSSIEYIRNYNFKDTTQTRLPLLLINSSDEVPITVNLQVPEPWIFIQDSTGNDMRYPKGNVVLNPTSSKEVVIIVDLPPEIESIPGTETVTLRPNITMDVKSGSFAIVPPPSVPTGLTQSDQIIPETYDVIVGLNQSTLLEFNINKEDGTPDFNVSFDEISFSVADPTIASADYDYQLVTSYSPVTIRGLSVGNTILNITAKGFTTSINVIVRPSTSSGTDRQNQSGQDENQNIN